MTEVAAAMGIANLVNLELFIATNRRVYQAYRQGIGAIRGLQLLAQDERESCSYQYIVVEMGDDFRISRDRIIEILHVESSRAGTSGQGVTICNPTAPTTRTLV